MPLAPWKVRVTADGTGTVDAIHATIELVDRAIPPGGLVALDGGYQNVGVGEVAFFTIDINDPLAATKLARLYGPSGEGGWYAYDGQAATQNAGPDRWLSAIATQDWDTSSTHRLELYLVDSDGTIIDQAIPVTVGTFADQMPYVTRVYRWGDDNLVLYLGYDGTSTTDSVFGLIVSTAGDTITVGNIEVLITDTLPYFHFAAASATAGAVVNLKRPDDGRIVNLTRSGLTLSAGTGTTFDLTDGFPNGLAHHAGNVYIVGYERYNGVEDGYRVAAIEPGTGVVASLSLEPAGGALSYNLQNNRMTGDHTLKLDGGYVTISTNFFGTYADRFQFDGATFTYDGRTTGGGPSNFDREPLRTVRLPSGWLSAWHDRYILWSPDFTSILAEGVFSPVRPFHFPAQLPDVPS